MNNADKYLLLCSLSFFFACFAISLISLNRPAPESYMYSPQAEPAQTAPIRNATRQYGLTEPKSLLHYPAQTASRDKTVTCWLQDAYDQQVAALKKGGATLAAKARMAQDRMEIYADEQGDFSVFVIGPDALNQPEACKVADGTGWQAP